MDLATLATLGAAAKTVGPVLIKCGEFVFKRYVPQLSAQVTEEGFAAVGKKAGGNGLLGRVGEATGRAFGWMAGFFVEDQIRPLSDKGAESLAQGATKYLLGAAGKAATSYVAKKIENAGSELNDTDMRIKQQTLKLLEAKTKKQELKGQLLEYKLAQMKNLEAERRLQIEADLEKRRQERENWKISSDKPRLDVSEKNLEKSPQIAAAA